MEEAQNTSSKVNTPLNPDFKPPSASTRALLVEEVELSCDRSGIVIIEPGSFNLRFGFAEAEDRRPGSVVSCVAYRRDIVLHEWSPPTPYQNGDAINGRETIQNENSEIMAVDGAQKQDDDEWIAALSQLEEEWREASGDLERANKNSPVRFLTTENCVDEVPEDASAPTEWANILSLPDHLVGDAALYLDDDDGYDIYFPFQNGRFNYNYAHMTSHKHNRHPITLMHVLDTIERLWRHVVFQKLEISEKTVGKFDVLLVIPDSFVPSEVQHMIDILLLKIGFGHIMLQKSSVCASLGAGKRGTCVINLGFSNTTVACIDDLDVVPGSAFSTFMGGIDISRFLQAQLKQKSEKHFFKYLDANLDASIQDLIIFEEMKETVCHLDPTLIQPKMYEFMVRHRNLPTSKLFRVNIGMAQIYSPMIICKPELDRYRKSRLDGIQSLDDGTDSGFQYSPNDPWGAQFYRPRKRGPIYANSPPTGNEIKTKLESTSMDVSGGDANLEGENALVEQLGDRKLTLVTPETMTKHEGVELGLAHLIIASIDSTASNDILRKRMYSQIVVVGGTAQFPNISELIETELLNVLSATNPPVVSVTTAIVGTEPIYCAWSGAALLVSQAPRDFWLDRVAWRTNGLLALREKLTFSWDNPQNRKLR